MPEEQEYEPPNQPRLASKVPASGSTLLASNAQGGVTVNPNRAVKFAEQHEGENNPVQQPQQQHNQQLNNFGGRVEQLRSSRKLPNATGNNGNIAAMNGRNPRHNSLETNQNINT